MSSPLSSDDAGQSPALRERTAELSASEARYRALFDSIDEGYCIIEMIFDEKQKPVDYRFLEINPSFEKQTGLQGALGRRMRELAPKHEAHWFEIYGRVAMTGEPVRFQNHAEQLHRWFDVYAFRFGEPKNRQVAILFNDITARKEMEESLRRSEENLAVTLQSIGDGMLATDAKGCVTRLNPVAAQLTGWRESEAQGRPVGEVFRIINEKTRQPSPVPVQDVLATGEIRGLANHTVLIARDGTEWPIADSCAPIRNAIGQIIGVVLVFRDVTEEQRAEREIRRLNDTLEQRIRERTAELRQNEEMLRSITDYTDDFVFIKDCEGRFVFANPALCRANGRTLEEMRGRTAAELNPDPAEVGRFTAEDRQVLSERRTITVEETRVIRATGERQTLLTIKSPRLDAEGKVIGLIGISHDITERKAAEEALRRSEASLATAQQQARIGNWEFDVVTRTGWWSAQMYRLWERDPALGAPKFEEFLEMIAPADRPKLIAHFDQTSRSASESEVEYRSHPARGAVRHFASHARAMADAEGRVIRLIGTTQDITERKQAEDTRAAAEAKFRVLVEQSLTGFYIIPKDRFSYVNQRMAEIYGVSPEELCARPIYDFILPEDRELVRENVRQRIEGKVQSIRYTFRIRRPTGEVRHVEVHGSLVDYEGQPAIMGTMLDVTERKHAEAQLAGERTLLRTLIDNLPGYIFVKDTAGRYLISNEAHTRLLGAAAESELIGRTVFDFFPPEAARKFEGDDKLLLQSGQPVLEREEQFDADGKSGWHSTTKVLLRDAQGSVAGIVGIRHHITDRKQAEEALRASEQRFRSFVTASSQVVWTTDPEGKVDKDLPEWQAFTGQSAQEARGFGWMNAIHPEDRERTAEAWRQANESRRFYEVEYRLRVHDGTWRHIQARGVPVLEADGSIREWVGTCIDITDRKRAEEALRESEERFRSIVQTEPECVKVMDDTGNLLEMNPAGLTMIEADSLEQIKGQPVVRLIAPEFRTAFDAMVQAVARGESRKLTFETVGLKGTRRWLESHTVPLRNGSEHITRLLGVTRDITERKQAEQALAESERFVRATLDSLPTCVAVLETDGTIVATNESWRLLATQKGMDWREVSDGTNYLTLCNYMTGAKAESVAEITTGIREVIAGRRTQFVTEFTSYVGTEQRCFVCRVSRFPGSGPMRVVVAHEDITLMRMAQRRFHDLFEFSPDAIVMTNREGVIKLVNRQAERMFGWTREEMIDQPVEVLMPQSSHEDHASLRQRFMLSAMPRNMGDGRTNLHGKRKDGTLFPVDISLSPMETEEGMMVAAAVRDITERKKAEQIANRSQRLESIGTLAGGIAHDLNNALGPIMMAVELLKMKNPDDVEMLETMESSAVRAAEMVRQLLTFAKGAEGRRVSIQPRHLVKEMEKIIRGTFPKNIQLQVRLSDVLPAVLGDATQLHQVLLNLCVNARDAMPHGGTLTLEAQPVDVDAAFVGSLRAAEAQPGHYLALRVTDTGTGIPPEILDRIFDPFFTTKGPDKGTGLGLSTVLGIVKGHGGFLQVSSQPGHGTTFGIFLPAEPSHGQAEEAARVHSNFRGKGETILFVDDEIPIRDIARAVLGRLNFMPMTATDGADALVQIAQNKAVLRVIITDLNMPHMDGLTLVRMVRRILPDIPMVVASGRLEENQAAEFKALGVHLTLDKPFTQDQMAEVLRAALQSSKPPAR